MIFFCMPFNNMSGSCMSMVKIKELSSSAFQSKMASPKGEFKNDIDVPEIRYNLFLHIFYFFKIFNVSSKKDIFIFNTVLCVFVCFLMSFFRRSYLYVHEDYSEKKFFWFLFNLLVSLSFIRLIVVNPKLNDLFWYKKGVLLCNFSNEDMLQSSEEKKIKYDYLMISNAFLFKGVMEFIELAKSNPTKLFALLTNDLTFYKSVTIPINLYLTTDQNIKKGLLSCSRFIVNLSNANETFGLTTFEGVVHGLLPITKKNMGSLFMLGEGFLFFDKTKKLTDLSDSLLSNEKIYRDILNERFKTMFSKKSALKQLSSIIRECS